MRRRFPPDGRRPGGRPPDDDPGRSNGWEPTDPWAHQAGYNAPGGSRSRMPAPGRDPSADRRPDDVPRYVPGAPPPYARDAASTRGRVPSRRPPVPPARPAQPAPPPSPARLARTDPALYEWDRLSPEQQQAVLAAIGTRSAPGLLRPTLIAAVCLLLLLVLLAALFVYLHIR